MISTLQVVPSIFDEASGVSPAVVRMAEQLARQEIACEVHTLKPLPPTLPQAPGLAFVGHEITALAGSLRVSKGLWAALRTGCKNAQILHNHSLWLMPNIVPYFCTRKTDCRLVVSPHGTLTSWSLARSRHKKKLVWWLGQSRTVLKADCIHVTSEQEYESLRALGIRVPVAVIPYGVDLPDDDQRSSEGPHRTLLFLSRLHPTKGVERLLQAWSELQERFGDWRLLIAGPGEARYVAQLAALAAQLKLQRVSFPGPVYGEDKTALYRAADLFVLPTHSENFGFVVAEALAHGVPAVVSRGAPWPGLEHEGCGRWVALDRASLRRGLTDMMQAPAEALHAAGQRGRAWMARDFSWQRSASQMAELYLWLCNEQERPPWVRMS